MTSHPLAKTNGYGQLSVQSIFFTPLQVKVSAKISYLRQALHPAANEKRGWGRTWATLWNQLSR